MELLVEILSCKYDEINTNPDPHEVGRNLLLAECLLKRLPIYRYYINCLGTAMCLGDMCLNAQTTWGNTW